MIKNVKVHDIKRNWHLVDAKDKVLGRIATSVALHLMGKNKSYYTPYMDTGDYVVIVNANNIRLTGKKEVQKKYYRHSGYPGGLYTKTAAQVRSAKPNDLVRHAIVGMLPKTRLGKQMLKKLYIYEGNQHPYQDKFKKES